MRLAEVFKGLNHECIKCIEGVIVEDFEIEHIEYDSRKCSSNTAFIALKGETVDGHNYIKNAYEKGSRVFIVSKSEIENIKTFNDAIFIKVENTRKALSKLSSNLFNEPSKKIKVIGVTGTKGKTTITNYLKSVLCESNLNTGVIGTNGIFFNDIFEPTINTTPESYEIHKTIRKMVDAGVECVAMEVSSGGLMMDRVDDVDFDIGIYTNISPDHIGPKEHPTFEDYLYCKSKLFSLCKFGIINADDEKALYIMENAKCEFETFSIEKESDLKAENIKLSRTEKILGASFDYVSKNSTGSVEICAPGKFSIYNALAVISACKYLKIDKSKMIEAFSKAKVDGRVEVLPIIPYATVIVDYAHNGMSLENVLLTLKQYNPSRLICLFGSVGGRTAIRRKELGDVAAKLCDVSIITTDNPDDEEPINIINDIAESFADSNCEVLKIIDRKEAIEKAISMAEDGDMVVLAGKGHETYQYIDGKRIYFNEKQIAKDFAKKMMKNK